MKISYFEWLVWLVDGGDHLLLLKDLYSLPFVPRIPFDENRAAYGVELRKACAVKNSGLKISRKEQEMPCSILELLVSLADRFEFELCDPFDLIDPEEGKKAKYFRIMLRNLGLDGMDDGGGYFDRGGRATVEAAVRRLNDRTYAYDGTGGLFPLRHPAQDQRSVEIWYQMNAYLIENYGYQLDAEEAEIAGKT